ncbi:hypothetical protein [Mycolicibacterium sp.]|uniref:hypothetical protein n=1 Tax=Mycolicibacterium sp. TaxID=2320850 RepID=UPI001A22669E|nr:hypothetical protein [Mycolicibacterium sp.]MBJ7338438.1 hypothetical protein [Mycolicibacterium sp.]
MTRANLQLTDYDAEGRPRVEDLELVAAPLTPLLTMELDGAAEGMRLTSDEILLAAMGRAIERTIGGGELTVDVPGYGTRVHQMALSCVASGQVQADEMLAGVHHALDALAVRRIVHGVPDDPRAQPVSEVLFASGDGAAERPHLGHVLELRTYRDGDVIALDWWFDGRSFEPYTVEELAEQFPLALIELTSEATPPIHATHELALAH